MSTALWSRFHWNSKICLRSVVTLPCIRFSCSELVGPEYASTVTIVKHMFSMHPKPLIQIHLYPDVFPRAISSQKTYLSWLAKCRYQRRFPVWGGVTCPFLLYVFIFSTPSSSCPSVKTFVGSLWCSGHSAGSGVQGVNQTYGIPFLKEFISEWPEKRPQDISLDWFWAEAVKFHIVGLIMWEEMTSCWEVILGRRKPWDSYGGGVGVEKQNALA